MMILQDISTAFSFAKCLHQKEDNFMKCLTTFSFTE